MSIQRYARKDPRPDLPFSDPEKSSVTFFLIPCEEEEEPIVSTYWPLYATLTFLFATIFLLLLL